jgi:hypothetical protein
MRERVALVSGILTIESTQGQGTTVLVRIPIPDQAWEDGVEGEPTNGAGG